MTENVIYVPTTPNTLPTIDPGSGIVGTVVRSGWIEIDYEGNRYHAVNIISYADRVNIALGRHETHYPTVARSLVEASRVQRVGVFESTFGRVDLDDDVAVSMLSKWLGREVEPRDLLATGHRYESLRRVAEWPRDVRREALRNLPPRDRAMYEEAGLM